MPYFQAIWNLGAGAFSLLLIGLFSISACSREIPAQNREEVIVFTAASLTDVVEALADSFEQAHAGVDVVVNVAGTSLLARQLEQGARADVFLSANIDWMEYLNARGKLEADERLPIRNALVVAARGADFNGVDFLLKAHRIAMADPEHVPAGIYARDAMQCLGVWDPLKNRVIPTLDVRAAVQALLHGGAPAAIVYRSDLLTMPEIETYSVIDEACQPDIQYRVGRLIDAPNPDGARNFESFLLSPKTAAFWTRFGFQYFSSRLSN